MLTKLREFVRANALPIVVVGASLAIAATIAFGIIWSAWYSAPSVAAPAAPSTVTVDGHAIVIPPGSTFEFTQDTTKTGGGITSKTTDRSMSYVDWSSAASIAGMLAENVDLKGLLTGPFGWIAGGTGLLGLLGGHKALKLHAHKHQSLGRAQVRNARPDHPTVAGA